MPTIKYDMITILGATASGKTTVAAHLAHLLDGEIISADSRQVYRGMDIGTGKDLQDYQIRDTIVPYHLINIADAGYRYSVFEYKRDFLQVYNDIKSRNKTAILCGGTGMYIEAVVSGYELEPVPPNENLRKELECKGDDELISILSSLKTLHNKTDIDTRKRMIRAIEIELYKKEHSLPVYEYPTINNIYFGIVYDLDSRRNRITQRLHSRLDEGMAEEIKNLLDNGLTPDDMYFYGLEYKYVAMYLTGQLDYDEMASKLNIAIHQFAKRQMTWFRGMERKGAIINWIDGHLPLEEKLQLIQQKITR